MNEMEHEIEKEINMDTKLKEINISNAYLCPWWPFEAGEINLNTKWKKNVIPPFIFLLNWIFIRIVILNNWWNDTSAWKFYKTSSHLLRFINNDLKCIQLMRIYNEYSNRKRPLLLFRGYIIGIPLIVLADADRNELIDINSCNCCLSLGITKCDKEKKVLDHLSLIEKF